ncbi:P-loop containing nucleoside triphosphate hydrolase protein, partial [Auriscalpium vulgare]
DAPARTIPKCLFYFETYRECTAAVETIRKILPRPLRELVQTFKSFTSEAGKEKLWDDFKRGDVRVLCATDAAGMGCNVPDVKYVAIFTDPRSFSTLIQRWGRAARSRDVQGTCLLFV